MRSSSSGDAAAVGNRAIAAFISRIQESFTLHLPTHAAAHALRGATAPHSFPCGCRATSRSPRGTIPRLPSARTPFAGRQEAQRWRLRYPSELRAFLTRRFAHRRDRERPHAGGCVAERGRELAVPSRCATTDRSCLARPNAEPQLANPRTNPARHPPHRRMIPLLGGRDSRAHSRTDGRGHPAPPDHRWTSAQRALGRPSVHSWMESMALVLAQQSLEEKRVAVRKPYRGKILTRGARRAETRPQDTGQCRNTCPRSRPGVARDPGEPTSGRSRAHPAKGRAANTHRCPMSRTTTRRAASKDPLR